MVKNRGVDTYPGKFEYFDDVAAGKKILYYEGRYANADQTRFYNYFYVDGEIDRTKTGNFRTGKAYTTLTGNTRASTSFKVDQKTQSFFPKGTDFTTYRNINDVNSRTPYGNRGWASPFGITREGTDEISRPYYNSSGKLVDDDKKAKFGEKSSRSSVSILNGPEEFLKHILVTEHHLTIGVFNFKIAVAKRAVKVFQESFNKQRFNSAGESKWEDLADFTQRKRKKRGTFPRKNPILKEYLDLQNSIVDEEHGANHRVTTKPIQASKERHKKRTGCWAYLHNEGVGTYGKGFGGRAPKPYVKRQFIGHSTLLDFNQDKFMNMLTRRYLFDAVFLTKTPEK